MIDQTLLQHAQRYKYRYRFATLILAVAWLTLLAFVRHNQGLIINVSACHLGSLALLPLALNFVTLVCCYQWWFGRPSGLLPKVLALALFWTLAAVALLMWASFYWVFVFQAGS